MAGILDAYRPRGILAAAEPRGILSGGWETEPFPPLRDPAMDAWTDAVRRGRNPWQGAWEPEALERDLRDTGRAIGLATTSPEAIYDMTIGSVLELPGDIKRAIQIGERGDGNPWADVGDVARLAAGFIPATRGVKRLDGYQGGHRAPVRMDVNSPAFDLEGSMPDIYGPNGIRYYGFGADAAGQAMDRETLGVLQGIRGKPDATVTIYRAVPKDAPDTINPGDWVTINPDYAALHGEGRLAGDFKIIRMDVRADELFTDGNSIHEFGFDPTP